LRCCCRWMAVARSRQASQTADPGLAADLADLAAGFVAGFADLAAGLSDPAVFLPLLNCDHRTGRLKTLGCCSLMSNPWRSPRCGWTALCSARGIGNLHARAMARCRRVCHRFDRPSVGVGGGVRWVVCVRLSQWNWRPISNAHEFTSGRFGVLLTSRSLCPLCFRPIESVAQGGVSALDLDRFCEERRIQGRAGPFFRQLPHHLQALEQR